MNSKYEGRYQITFLLNLIIYSAQSINNRKMLLFALHAFTKIPRIVPSCYCCPVFCKNRGLVWMLHSRLFIYLIYTHGMYLWLICQFTFSCVIPNQIRLNYISLYILHYKHTYLAKTLANCFCTNIMCLFYYIPAISFIIQFITN